MQTVCAPDSFGFAPIEGGKVVLSMVVTFPGMPMHQTQELLEHKVARRTGQRVIGRALAYEDLNDHDDLRHDQ
jgi:hypothetical protein